jgi:hypothetical protein
MGQKHILRIGIWDERDYKPGYIEANGWCTHTALVLFFTWLPKGLL